MSKGITLITMLSAIATVAGALIFRSIHGRIPLHRPPGMVAFAVALLIGMTVYCDAQGWVRLSYVYGIAALLGGSIFALSAFAALLGPDSALYRFLS